MSVDADTDSHANLPGASNPPSFGGEFGVKKKPQSEQKRYELLNRTRLYLFRDIACPGTGFCFLCYASPRYVFPDTRDRNRRLNAGFHRNRQQ